MVVIEVRNAELMETLVKEAKRLDIVNGAIVSLIGSRGQLHYLHHA